MRLLLTQLVLLAIVCNLGGCCNRSENICAEPSGADTSFVLRLEGESCGYADFAEYGFYMPATADNYIRGILVLQHGCGMEMFGITRIYDLQYREFARKWNLAVIETAIHGNCKIWHDPESGSYDGLNMAIGMASAKTNHPELNDAPFLLFGHSAGGYWTLAMIRDYPERVIAAVTYSAAQEPQWNEYKPAAADVPLLMRHAGVNDGVPSIKCRETAEQAFAALRNMDAPVSIALTEGQNHNYSYMRYVAIPFYESALRHRLPEEKGGALKPVKDNKDTWLGDPVTLEICKESKYKGDKDAMCRFLDKETAENWQEYSRTGILCDKTPPPAPYDVTVVRKDGNLEISWSAPADIESGIMKFNIYADGNRVARYPELGSYQTFDKNGDNTVPVEPVPMSYVIPDKGYETISVETVNHFYLTSEKTLCTEF